MHKWLQHGILVIIFERNARKSLCRKGKFVLLYPSFFLTFLYIMKELLTIGDGCTLYLISTLVVKQFFSQNIFSAYFLYLGITFSLVKRRS